MSAPTTVASVTRREFARLEGCDEKQVRRGLERGALVAGADGKLDPAQVGNGWRRPRTDSRQAPAAKGADRSADSAKSVRAPAEPAGDEVGGVPVVQSAQGSRLKDMVTRKEEFAGRLRELEYRQKAGELIELETARQILFQEFRASRDAWMNWPMRYAALIAAELGVEADRVAETLTSYVHKQLATLGEPAGEFR